MMKALNKRFPWELDWNLLRTFMVIVEQQGITNAADHLGLKQPTVSNALRRLETRMDLRLIERTPGSFKVTQQGELLYQECAEVFRAISLLPELIENTGNELTGHISIAMASHVIADFFDHTLAAFSREHPKITLSISIMESKEVLKNLLQKKFSFGICLVDQKDSRLDYHPMFRETFALYCGPDHRFFQRNTIKLQELEGEPSVSFQTDHQQDVLRSVRELRVKARLSPHLRGVSSSLQEVRRMIITGFGIGPLPIHIARKDVEAGLLWQLPPYKNLPEVDVHFVHKLKGNKNPAEKALIDHFIKTIKATPLQERTYL
ncbi:LysR family transcriptional regulator [Terasakiella pusilla]|uniref:LysR family transcriptional regulator n=1 Tax=Terasakiella pusilla TaxID=64973 RepID=UPI00048FDE89|nr:LysR family transcriptional regulator [Terasakiella pusilla]